MGYYSDVRVVLNRENWTDFYKAIEMNSKFSTLDKEWFLNSCEITELDKGIIVVSWYYIKWNTSNEMIANFMDWLYRMQEENVPFQFIRIGEEIGDFEEIESFGEDWEYEDDYRRLCINCSIDVME